MSAGSRAPAASVVLATHNRPQALRRLLSQLAGQTLASDSFEVVVVDDGSRQPARDAVESLAVPYRLTLIAQPNAGAAAARHRGIMAASGDLLVITDDDMSVPPAYLAEHLSLHPVGSRRVVMGRIRPSPNLARLPLFERWHAAALEKQTRTEKQRTLRGNALCTGNVSMRRSDYLAVGGFDPSLERGEDMDLGLRLEQAGAELRFSEEAFTVHDSDHTDFDVWRGRAYRYGLHEVRIARKHPAARHADPWRFFFGNSLAKRPFVFFAVLAPALARGLASVVVWLALAADHIGLERPALAATSLIWDLEYFRGVRVESGSLSTTVRSALAFLRKAPTPAQEAPAS